MRLWLRRRQGRFCRVRDEHELQAGPVVDWGRGTRGCPASLGQSGPPRAHVELEGVLSSRCDEQTRAVRGAGARREESDAARMETAVGDGDELCHPR